MFFTNILKMSHRYLIPFACSKSTSDVTKELIKIEREKINNKLMIQLKDKELSDKELKEQEFKNYLLKINEHRYMKK
jgi:hypothetical protein